MSCATMDSLPGTVERIQVTATPTADMSVFAEDSRVVCSQDGHGNEALSLTGMENCLQANPEINLVYTINEPAACGVLHRTANRGQRE